MNDQDFLALLNILRAEHGLAVVYIDPGLNSWAVMNNALQIIYGLGHWIMGPARRQNVAWGYTTVGQVTKGWLMSPGHRANLLAPEITYIGIDKSELYWTYNAK